MEISVDVLKQRPLMVCTPMYGGMCYGLHAKSISDLTLSFNQMGMMYNYFALFNESLITRARNYLADEFVRSDATHLLFIDSDIEFHPHAVLDLLALADPESDKDIICGPYPKKNISWEKVVNAVNQGIADTNPNVLENFIGDFVLSPAAAGEHKMTELLEIKEAGTGFMMIQKRVFTKILEAKPELLYTPDHLRSKAFDGSRQIGAYFQDPIIDGRHLSEDYFFCHLAREVGLKVWLAPWIPLNHMGYYKFTGNLPAVVSIGSPVTADPKNVPKD